MIEGLILGDSFKDNVHIKSHIDRSSQNLIAEANIDTLSRWRLWR